MVTWLIVSKFMRWERVGHDKFNAILKPLAVEYSVAKSMKLKQKHYQPVVVQTNNLIKDA